MMMTCTLYKARSTPVAVSAPIHRIECIRLSLYSSRSCVRTHDMTPHQMHILSLPSPPPPSKKPRCSTYLAHALHAYRPTGRWRSGTAPPLPLPQLADRMRTSGSVRHPFGQQRKVLHADGLAVQLAFRIVWWRAAVNTNRNKKNKTMSTELPVICGWRSLSVDQRLTQLSERERRQCSACAARAHVSLCLFAQYYVFR